MNKNNSLLGIVVGAIGVAYGLYSQYKMSKVAEKVGVAISELDTSINVDVPKKIVDAAIEKAVDREVSTLAEKAAITVSSEITTNMSKLVKQAIDVNFSTISEKVSTELADQVAKFDADALRDKVSAKAEKKVLDKLDGVISTASDTFNKELKNTAKVYSSMMYQIPRYDAGKSVYFRI